MIVHIHVHVFDKEVTNVLPKVCLSGLSGGKQNINGIRRDNNAQGTMSNIALNPGLL